MLDKDDWKLAIEDARTRHTALVNLIYFTDSQAMTLLGMYVGFATASAAGAAASFSKSTWVLPIAVGWGLSVATIGFFIGAIYCFRAMAPSTINLPGRGAEFWIWANHPDITRKKILDKYFENLNKKTAMNIEVNKRASKQLGYAKAFGLAAPFFSLIFGCTAAYCA